MPSSSGPSGPAILPARALRPLFQAEFNNSEGLKGRPFNRPRHIRRFRIPAAGRIFGICSELSLCCDGLFDGRCQHIRHTWAERTSGNTQPYRKPDLCRYLCSMIEALYAVNPSEASMAAGFNWRGDAPAGPPCCRGGRNWMRGSAVASPAR